MNRPPDIIVWQPPLRNVQDPPRQRQILRAEFLPCSATPVPLVRATSSQTSHPPLAISQPPKLRGPAPPHSPHPLLRQIRSNNSLFTRKLDRTPPPGEVGPETVAPAPAPSTALTSLSHHQQHSNPNSSASSPPALQRIEFLAPEHRHISMGSFTKGLKHCETRREGWSSHSFAAQARPPPFAWAQMTGWLPLRIRTKFKH